MVIEAIKCVEDVEGENMVEVGDDISIEGVVKFVEEDCKAILIETEAGTPIWVSPKDIKTHRPNKKG